VAEEKVTGREPKPEFEKTNLKLYQETVNLIQQLPLRRRYEMIGRSLVAGLRKLLKQAGAK
jgi:hypothetical protein